ncbi:16033_t:CDS:2, partial [Dentiscutata erythropus]
MLFHPLIYGLQNISDLQKQQHIQIMTTLLNNHNFDSSSTKVHLQNFQNKFTQIKDAIRDIESPTLSLKTPNPYFWQKATPKKNKWVITADKLIGKITFYTQGTICIRHWVLDQTGHVKPCPNSKSRKWHVNRSLLETKPLLISRPNQQYQYISARHLIIHHFTQAFTDIDEKLWETFVNLPSKIELEAKILVKIWYNNKRVIPTATIYIDNKPIIAIQNKTWPTPQKVGLTALLILLILTPSESKIVLSTNSTFICDIRFDHYSEPLWLQQIKRQDYADYKIGIDTLINIKFFNVVLNSITPTTEHNPDPVLTEFILSKALTPIGVITSDTRTPRNIINAIELYNMIAKQIHELIWVPSRVAVYSSPVQNNNSTNNMVAQVNQNQEDE